MDLFLLLVSQIFDAFVEISTLLIILDILVKFSNFTFILEFMLLTRFNILKGKRCLLAELPMHYDCKRYVSACKASLTGR